MKFIVGLALVLAAITCVESMPGGKPKNNTIHGKRNVVETAGKSGTIFVRGKDSSKPLMHIKLGKLIEYEADGTTKVC